MFESKGEISINQLMLLFVSTIIPTAWFSVSGFAQIANQAAWLCPLVVLLLYLLLLFVFKIMYERYGSISFMEIICNITSNAFGKVILSLYVVMLTIELLFFVRFNGEHYVGSITPNTKIELYIIATLVLAAFILRSGLVVLARMNEIVFAVSAALFGLLIILLLPNVKIENLTPISSLDIIPIFEGSTGMLSLCYLPYFLFLTSEVSDIKNFWRVGVKIVVFIVSFTLLVAVSSIGTIGAPFISKSLLSFLVAVQHLNLLNIIGGFQSVFIIAISFTNFMTICIFTYIILKLIAFILNLKHNTSLINVFLLLIFFLVMGIGTNIFEINDLASTIIPASILFNIIIPLIIFLIGKIRKKI